MNAPATSDGINELLSRDEFARMMTTILQDSIPMQEEEPEVNTDTTTSLSNSESAQHRHITILSEEKSRLYEKAKRILSPINQQCVALTHENQILREELAELEKQNLELRVHSDLVDMELTSNYEVFQLMKEMEIDTLKNKIMSLRRGVLDAGGEEEGVKWRHWSL
jgi:predicted RNase H-like nuclease (RuvC/YqgF family)